MFTSAKVARGEGCLGPRGVLKILSDGDDRRIFLGLKFSIRGFFLGTKIWQVFFFGGGGGVA